MKDLESSSSEDEDSDEDDSSNYLWRYTYVPVYRPRTAKVNFLRIVILYLLLNAFLLISLFFVFQA
jgi:hypothetical protein